MKSNSGQGTASKKNTSGEIVMPFDSDEHDDFNPIQDLMPPSIAESGDLDQVGKKRGRTNDPLRRLLEETSEEELSMAAQGPLKRQKVSSER